MMKPLIEINGTPASAGSLSAALPNYGHFTSMQVRGGRVAGLQLHLQRLQSSTQMLFASELDIASVRAWLQQALQHAGAAAIEACSVRINVHAAQFDRDRPGAPQAVDVMITVSAPWQGRTQPIRVQAQSYQRDLPEVKHVGTFGLFWQRQLALQAGYDDALFVDHAGRISEGSVWNIGFWDGEQLIWPQAAMLDGVTQQLLKAALAAAGIAQQTRELRLPDLAGFKAAFSCNSTGVGTPIVAIDEWRFVEDPAFNARLLAAYESVAADAIL
ncbi:aminotransferase class IV [Hydrocarboniphaga sp.]|uniref:aminotransferase class IV n=1 Tax=Hydrocarboniphaga sp. TaxID=2033016 RepID=UPI00262DB16F|nr:aminotransferase class IV [Hydrocarboniphaga sp.]